SGRMMAGCMVRRGWAAGAPRHGGAPEQPPGNQKGYPWRHRDDPLCVHAVKRVIASLDIARSAVALYMIVIATVRTPKSPPCLICVTAATSGSLLVSCPRDLPGRRLGMACFLCRTAGCGHALPLLLVVRAVGDRPCRQDAQKHERRDLGDRQRC